MNPAAATSRRKKPGGFFTDLSGSAVIAGIVAIIVGFTIPSVLLLQVVEAAGLPEAEAASWIWAFCIGSAIVSLYASWTTRQPLVVALSIPGTAFLVTAMPGVAFSDVIGAFIISNAIIFPIGYFGLFNRIMAWIPMSVAAALIAGILLPFALDAIASAGTEPMIVTTMIAAFFLARIFAPRWAVAAVLLTGFGMCIALGRADFTGFEFALTVPVFTAPTFSPGAIINIAIPLTLLALTGQYLPGFALLKSYGYRTDNDRLVKYCSIASLVFAPFGINNIVPSMVISGIVSAPEAHPDPARRYCAVIVTGILYIVFGSLTTTIIFLFFAVPPEMIITLAGIALLAPITHNISTAMREAGDDVFTPTIVFITAISGFEFLSIGSTFWAIVIGLGLAYIERRRTAN